MCAETTGPAGLHPHTNPHWRPQRFMCNLEKFLPAYNFVGSFAHLQAHTEKLLRGRALLGLGLLVARRRVADPRRAAALAASVVGRTRVHVAPASRARQPSQANHKATTGRPRVRHW